MEMDFCAFLGDPAFANEDPGLWHGMKVTRHEGSEWLIMGRAHGRTADTIKIENALAEIWESRLRYEYREAHTSNASGEAVHFQAVTQTAPGGMWVTVDVWVTLH